MLSETPDLAGVFLASDTLYLDPVTAALSARGRLVPMGQPGHVTLVSVDGGQAAMEALRENTMDAVISQPVTQYSQVSIEYLKRAHDGQSLTVGPTNHNSVIVEQDGFLVDLLPAPVVTARTPRARICGEPMSEATTPAVPTPADTGVNALVVVRNAVKRFGATTALNNLSITIRQGQSHGLLGRNGAEKSTLMATLTGLHALDSGSLEFDGQPAPSLTDRSAWLAKVSCVYQHRTLVPEMSVAENP